MTERLPFRILPKARIPQDVDRVRLEQMLCGVVRAVHPHRPSEPHQGQTQEEVFIRSAVQRRGCIHVRYGYHRDRHPNSRYDKSEQAEGRLRLGLDGTVLELSLGQLKSST